MSQIENNADQNVCKIIIATKGDLEDERSVSTECGVALAQKHGLKFVEVSSKSGKNINQAIENLIEEVNVNIEEKKEAAGVAARELLISSRDNESSRKKCAC